jgi:hypothetical protein
MKLVFVHGRAQEDRSSTKIATEWMTALNEGMSKAKLRALNIEPIVPYYGNELISLINKGRKALEPELTPPTPSSPRDPDLAIRGPSYRNLVAEFADVASQRVMISDDELYRHGFRPRRPASAGDDDIRRPRRDAPATRLGEELDNSDRGPQNWSWVLAVVRRLDELFPGLSSGGIELILRDVYLYCTDSKLREAIDKVVADALPPGPSIVIGHSLGTVVAYNVLHATKAKIAHFVTIGSPLAINAIKQRLKVRPSRPSGVGNWYNARDPKDIVALNPLTAGYFPTEPQIDNNDGIINPSENKHHISGYLGHPDIAAYISRIWSASVA